MPNPSSFFKLAQFFSFYRAYLPTLCFPAQQKISLQLSNLMAHPHFALKKDRKYKGVTVITNFIKHILDTKDKYLTFT